MRRSHDPYRPITPARVAPSPPAIQLAKCARPATKATQRVLLKIGQLRAPPAAVFVAEPHGGSGDGGGSQRRRRDRARSPRSTRLLRRKPVTLVTSSYVTRSSWSNTALCFARYLSLQCLRFFGNHEQFAATRATPGCGLFHEPPRAFSRLLFLLLSAHPILIGAATADFLRPRVDWANFYAPCPCSGPSCSLSSSTDARHAHSPGA